MSQIILLFTIAILSTLCQCQETAIETFQDDLANMLKTLRTDLVEQQLKLRLQKELIELYRQLLNYHDGQVSSDHKIAKQARLVLSLVHQIKEAVKRSVNNVRGGRNLIIGAANKIDGRNNAIKGDANTVVGGSNVSLGSDNIMVGEGAKVSGNGGFVVGKDISLKGQDCVVFSSKRNVERDSKLIVNDYALDINDSSGNSMAIQKLEK